jgi:hypothetical protein
MKMKNKKEEQKARKEEHRERQKAAKQKRKRSPKLERNEPEKAEKESILIVCEGKNTEPSYFNSFRLASATIRATGDGKNTISLVQEAQKLALKDDYDQVWCVFDKDGFPNEHFNNAIYMAESQGFKVAYSNQAFEYWLILHFEDHQGSAMGRKEYCKKLNTYLAQFGVSYDCDGKMITQEIFDILTAISPDGRKTYQQIAIDRGKRNMEYFDNTNPALEESSTLVFKLVEELEKFK